MRKDPYEITSKEELWGQYLFAVGTATAGKGVPYLKRLHADFKVGKISKTEFARKIKQAQVDNNFYRDGSNSASYHTGRYEPKSLKEKLAMEEAFSNPNKGSIIENLKINDPKGGWYKADGWVKVRQRINGIEIHYLKNTKTSEFTDFKLKDK